jgi:hypothetical protein
MGWARFLGEREETANRRITNIEYRIMKSEKKASGLRPRASGKAEEETAIFRDL